jgi:hypothetical protein
MKNFLILLTGLIFATANAQEQEKIDYINANDVQGVYRAGKKAVCISFSENRAYDHKSLYVLQVLGEDKVNKQVIEVEEGSQIMDVVSNSKQAIVLFQNQNKELLEMVALDQNGKIVSNQKYQTDVNDLEFYGYFSKWALSETNKLFMVRTYSLYEEPKPRVRKLVNQGYQLLSLNTDATLAGAYSENGMDKPGSDIKTLLAYDEGCVVFLSQSESKKKTFSARLEMFSNIAAQTGTYALSGEDFTYYPTGIIYNNGEIVAAGMYFKGLWYNAKTSEGLFLLKTNMKGEKLALSGQTWTDLKTKLGTVEKSDFMFNGKTDFLVEAIQETPTGYVIVGESFGKSSGVSGAEFILDTEDNSDSRVLSVYNFIVIETDKNGMLSSVRSLKKENSNIKINGGISMLRNVELSFMLKKYNKFPFQSISNNEIHYIAYKNKEGFYNVMDIKTGEIKSSVPIKLVPEIEAEVDVKAQELIEGSKVLSKLDRLSQKMDNLDKKLDAAGSKLDYAISKTDVEFYPGQRDNTGIILMGDGSSVSYIVHPETHAIYYIFY